MHPHKKVVSMDSSPILGDSWQLIWRQKSLVILGLVGVIGGELLTMVVRLRVQPWLAAISAEGVVNFLNDPIPAGTFASVPSIGLLFLLFIAAWLLSVLAEGGLIQAIYALAKGRPLGLKQTWGGSLRLLGRFIVADTLLFLPLFLYLLLLLLLLGIGLALFVVAVGGNEINIRLALSGVGLAGLVCGLPMVAFLVPAGALTWLLRLLTFRAIAVDGLGVRDSIRRAWQMIRSRPGPIILVGALLWGVGRLTRLFITLLVLPFNTLGIGGGNVGNWGIVLGTLVGLFPQALLYVFVAAAWTIAYQRLNQ